MRSNGESGWLVVKSGNERQDIDYDKLQYQVDAHPVPTSIRPKAKGCTHRSLACNDATDVPSGVSPWGSDWRPYGGSMTRNPTIDCHIGSFNTATPQAYPIDPNARQSLALLDTRL